MEILQTVDFAKFPKEVSNYETSGQELAFINILKKKMHAVDPKSNKSGRKEDTVPAVARKESNDYEGDSDEMTMEQFFPCDTKKEYFEKLEEKIRWAKLYSKNRKTKYKKIVFGHMHEGKRRVYIHSRKKDFVIDTDPSKNRLLKFMKFDGFKACGDDTLDPAIKEVRKTQGEDPDTKPAIHNEEEVDDSVEEGNSNESLDKPLLFESESVDQSEDSPEKIPL
jgi:hypothetical protein